MDFPILTCCFQMSNATESIPKACSHVLKRMYCIYYVLSLIKQCYGNYIKEKQSWRTLTPSVTCSGYSWSSSRTHSWLRGNFIKNKS